MSERKASHRQRQQNSSAWFFKMAILMISIALLGCASVSSQDQASQQLRGVVAQVETGKDGVQVELETETGQYSVTISVIQAEIDGDLDRIQVGTEIIVTGRRISDVSPPLVVADKVTVLEPKD